MNELIYQKLYTDTSFHVNGIIFADLSNLLHNLRINLCPSDNCCDQATLLEVFFRMIPGTKRQRDVKYKLFCCGLYKLYDVDQKLYLFTWTASMYCRLEDFFGA